MNSSELQNWQYFTRPALSVLAVLLPADCTFWPWELACS